MRIYITGIAGMLGYNLYRTLRGRAEITGIDSAGIEIPGCSYRRGSLFDAEAAEADIAGFMPDVLIHTAAFVSVDGCEKDPASAKRLNTDVTERLAGFCHTRGIKMVYISTDAVFDGEESRLYTEEDTPRPLNVYGRTKLDGETAVLHYPEHLVLRTNIYGINIRKKQSFGEWIYDALKEDRSLKLFTDIDFSPILATELAELIYEMCRNRLCGLYHACGTGCMTKYEFGRKLKEIFRIETGEILPSESGAAHLAAKRARHMGMSNRKLREGLQVQISTPEEGIRQFSRLLGERRRVQEEAGPEEGI